MSSTLTHGLRETRNFSAQHAYRPNILVRLFNRLAQEIRVRRDMRLLASFDEAALHDIGLTRSGTEDAVRHGRGPVPAAFQQSISAIDEAVAIPSFDSEWR